jgi:hypothetical protein
MSDLGISKQRREQERNRGNDLGTHIKASVARGR